MITTSADGAWTVYATDLDGDGDADVLSASYSDDKIAWYENQGGGFFGPRQVITSTSSFVWSVYATDLDGDGDADVLSASASEIAWYENTGGGSFGPTQVIGGYGCSVYATDLDGDGDTDVVSAFFLDTLINWYENLGGGSFGPQEAITTSADNCYSVYATDLDGDGDADVLSASAADDKIAWYENLGGGVFGPQQVVSTSADGAASVYATDLDGDGDADVLSASRFDDKIAWYENLMGPFDCNGNGVSDALDIANGTAADCNVNGIPIHATWLRALLWTATAMGFLMSATSSPARVIATGTVSRTNATLRQGTAPDCDANGIPDSCDLAAGGADCDADGVLDSCQISADLTLDLNGNGVLDACEAIGLNYCTPAISNSRGGPAEIFALGLPVAASNDLTLYLRGLPLDTFAMFLTSQSQGYAFPIPGSQGALCVVGLPGRFNRHGQILSSGFSGTLRFVVNLGSIPTPSGFTAVVPGQTWNFQAWYRDANPTVTSNFTDAVSITFQ